MTTAQDVPHDTLDRLEHLEILSKEIRGLEDKLAGGDTTKAKWDWPPEAYKTVKELRKLAQNEDNYKVVHGPLDKLLEWPNKDLADPKLFYGGKAKFELFNRTEDWFSDMGFEKFETQYTFSNSWDKGEINATFLVPNTIKHGDKCPVMWFFHGGGFCTGAGDHIPWYSKASLKHAKKHKAIIIAPDYPLGPEGNYKDIVDSMRDFLRFYKEDGFFKTTEADEENWTKWLINKIGKTDVTLDKDRVFVEGDSAGSHAAVTALFLNAEEKVGTKLMIKAVLLRYPMVKHYERSMPADGESLGYMGKTFSQDKIFKQAESVVEEIKRLDKLDLCPSYSKGYAPQHMSAAFLLSMTRKWQSVFQRQHGGLVDQEVDPGDFSYMDCLEHAEKWVDKVDHKWLPPIIMFHGYDDTNCPFENTEEFKNLLMKHYPGTYTDEETVFLWRVTELHERPYYNEEKKKIETKHTTEVGHAFDYDLREESEGFLKESYATVDRFWMAK